MTHAFFQCFPTVRDFAEQLDAYTPCGIEARSFLAFYQRDPSDQVRREYLDKVWEHQRAIGNVPQDERERAILSYWSGAVGGKEMPLALQPPFRSHLLMGGCFYLGGMLDFFKKNRKNVYVVETDQCNEDIMGIPKWLGRESDSPLPRAPSMR